MRRFLAGLLLTLLILSGCAQRPTVLLDTQTCRVTQEGDKISVYCTETDETYFLTVRKIRTEKGIKPPVRALVVNDALCIKSRRNVLMIEDRAACREYVIVL